MVIPQISGCRASPGPRLARHGSLQSDAVTADGIAALKVGANLPRVLRLGPAHTSDAG
jgi:hypothetical protein